MYVRARRGMRSRGVMSTLKHIILNILYLNIYLQIYIYMSVFCHFRARSQVDHASQSVLRDGVTFVMSGWFAGGYGHESVGLPPVERMHTRMKRDEISSRSCVVIG